MPRLFNLVAFSAAFLSAFSLTGCGGGSAGVHGKVTLDGQPLETGVISFQPMEGTAGPAAGATIAQGEYKVQGEAMPSPGTYRVEIKSQKKTGKKMPVGSPAPPGTMAEETIEAVPPQYNKKSTLQRELKGGQNTVDFELASK